MTSLYDRIQEAAAFIRERTEIVPEFAVILGTGLGGLSREISHRGKIPYTEIPGFLPPTVHTHSGELILGKMGERTVAAMEGRLHFYEGYSLDEIVFPVRVLRAMGAGILIVSNASGAMNPLFSPGDLVFMEDHINLMGVNPLIGPNDDRIGPRYPDMCEPYSRELIRLAEEIALEKGIRTHRGVYAAVTGPNVETRAEYRFLRCIGADIVGMSTVPEVLAAIHGGFKILGISCVTDMCLPDALKPIDVEEIIDIANRAELKLTQIIKELILRCPRVKNV